MQPLIIRKNRLFVIDETVLPEKAKKPQYRLALYAAMHDEFKGAIESEKYCNMTPAEKMQHINDFAWKWLQDRKLHN